MPTYTFTPKAIFEDTDQITGELNDLFSLAQATENKRARALSKKLKLTDNNAHNFHRLICLPERARVILSALQKDMAADRAAILNPTFWEDTVAGCVDTEVKRQLKQLKNEILDCAAYLLSPSEALHRLGHFYEHALKQLRREQRKYRNAYRKAVKKRKKHRIPMAAEQMLMGGFRNSILGVERIGYYALLTQSIAAFELQQKHLAKAMLLHLEASHRLDDANANDVPKYLALKLRELHVEGNFLNEIEAPPTRTGLQTIGELHQPDDLINQITDYELLPEPYIDELRKTLKGKKSKLKSPAAYFRHSVAQHLKDSQNAQRRLDQLEGTYYYGWTTGENGQVKATSDSEDHPLAGIVPTCIHKSVSAALGSRNLTKKKYAFQNGFKKNPWYLRIYLDKGYKIPWGNFNDCAKKLFNLLPINGARITAAHFKHDGEGTLLHTLTAFESAYIAAKAHLKRHKPGKLRYLAKIFWPFGNINRIYKQLKTVEAEFDRTYRNVQAWKKILVDSAMAEFTGFVEDETFTARSIDHLKTFIKRCAPQTAAEKYVEINAAVSHFPQRFYPLFDLPELPHEDALSTRRLQALHASLGSNSPQQLSGALKNLHRQLRLNNTNTLNLAKQNESLGALRSLLDPEHVISEIIEELERDIAALSHEMRALANSNEIEHPNRAEGRAATQQARNEKQGQLIRFRDLQTEGNTDRQRHYAFDYYFKRPFTEPQMGEVFTEHLADAFSLTQTQADHVWVAVLGLLYQSVPLDLLNDFYLFDLFFRNAERLSTHLEKDVGSALKRKHQELIATIKKRVEAEFSAYPIHTQSHLEETEKLIQLLIIKSKQPHLEITETHSVSEEDSDDSSEDDNTTQRELNAIIQSYRAAQVDLTTQAQAFVENQGNYLDDLRHGVLIHLLDDPSEEAIRHHLDAARYLHESSTIENLAPDKTVLHLAEAMEALLHERDVATPSSEKAPETPAQAALLLTVRQILQRLNQLSHSEPSLFRENFSQDDKRFFEYIGQIPLAPIVSILIMAKIDRVFQQQTDNPNDPALANKMMNALWIVETLCSAEEFNLIRERCVQTIFNAAGEARYHLVKAFIAYCNTWSIGSSKEERAALGNLIDEKAREADGWCPYLHDLIDTLVNNDICHRSLRECYQLRWLDNVYVHQKNCDEYAKEYIFDDPPKYLAARHERHDANLAFFPVDPLDDSKDYIEDVCRQLLNRITAHLANPKLEHIHIIETITTNFLTHFKHPDPEHFDPSLGELRHQFYVFKQFNAATDQIERLAFDELGAACTDEIADGDEHTYGTIGAITRTLCDLDPNLPSTPQRIEEYAALLSRIYNRAEIALRRLSDQFFQGTKEALSLEEILNLERSRATPYLRLTSPYGWTLNLPKTDNRRQATSRDHLLTAQYCLTMAFPSSESSGDHAERLKEHHNRYYTLISDLVHTQDRVLDILKLVQNPTHENFFKNIHFFPMRAIHGLFIPSAFRHDRDSQPVSLGTMNILIQTIKAHPPKDALLAKVLTHYQEILEAIHKARSESSKVNYYFIDESHRYIRRYMQALFLQNALRKSCGHYAKTTKVAHRNVCESLNYKTHSSDTWEEAYPHFTYDRSVTSLKDPLDENDEGPDPRQLVERKLETALKNYNPEEGFYLPDREFVCTFGTAEQRQKYDDLTQAYESASDLIARVNSGPLPVDEDPECPDWISILEHAPHALQIKLFQVIQERVFYFKSSPVEHGLDHIIKACLVQALAHVDYCLSHPDPAFAQPLGEMSPFPQALFIATSLITQCGTPEQVKYFEALHSQYKQRYCKLIDPRDTTTSTDLSARLRQHATQRLFIMAIENAQHPETEHHVQWKLEEGELGAKKHLKVVRDTLLPHQTLRHHCEAYDLMTRRLEFGFAQLAQADQRFTPRSCLTDTIYQWHLKALRHAHRYLSEEEFSLFRAHLAERHTTLAKEIDETASAGTVEIQKGCFKSHEYKTIRRTLNEHFHELEQGLRGETRFTTEATDDLDAFDLSLVFPIIFNLSEEVLYDKATRQKLREARKALTALFCEKLGFKHSSTPDKLLAKNQKKASRKEKKAAKKQENAVIHKTINQAMTAEAHAQYLVLRGLLSSGNSANQCKSILAIAELLRPNSAEDNQLNNRALAHVEISNKLFDDQLGVIEQCRQIPRDLFDYAATIPDLLKRFPQLQKGHFDPEETPRLETLADVAALANAERDLFELVFDETDESYYQHLLEDGVIYPHFLELVYLVGKEREFFTDSLILGNGKTATNNPLRLDPVTKEKFIAAMEQDDLLDGEKVWCVALVERLTSNATGPRPDKRGKHIKHLMQFKQNLESLFQSRAKPHAILAALQKFSAQYKRYTRHYPTRTLPQHINDYAAVCDEYLPTLTHFLQNSRASKKTNEYNLSPRQIKQMLSRQQRQRALIEKAKQQTVIGKTLLPMIHALLNVYIEQLQEAAQHAPLDRNSPTARKYFLLIRLMNRYSNALITGEVDEERLSGIVQKNRALTATLEARWNELQNPPQRVDVPTVRVIDDSGDTGKAPLALATLAGKSLTVALGGARSVSPAETASLATSPIQPLGESAPPSP